MESGLTGGSIELGVQTRGSGSHLGAGGGTWMKGRPGDRQRAGSAIVMDGRRGTGSVGEQVSGVTANFLAGQLEDASATA